MRSGRTAGKHKISLNYSGIEVFKKNIKVKDALKVFSEKNSKLSRSSKTLGEKLNKIANEIEMGTGMGIILLNTISTYSNASESLHGSLFGCTYHTGIYDPNIDHSDIGLLNKNLLKNTSFIYGEMICLIHAVIKIVKGDKIGEILNESEKNIQECASLLKEEFKGN